MKKSLLILCLIVLLLTPVLAQVDCSNIGFEQGNTSGWNMTYGTVTDANSKTVFGTEISGNLNDHYVTSLSDGNDPKIPSIPMVAPGSTHSIRIGNIIEGSHYSRIHADYTVTADNTLFQYKFAVVLQNTIGNTGVGGGGAIHEPFQKPGFNILIFDSNGDELTCSSYDIQLQGTDTVEGFEASGDIQYRNWTTGAIDLRKYVGKTITIVVTAHGCTRMRHFGYAYFDAECLKSEIEEASVCPDDAGFMTLMAPSGFGKYVWSNGETTQNISVKAKLGDQYHVKLEPLGSLNESCALQLDYTIEYKKTAASIEKMICEGEQVAVGDTVYRTSGTFVRNINRSNVCDSTVTLKLTVNPVPEYTQTISICEGESVTVGDTTYKTSGTYVRVIPQITGCDSTVTTNLTVIELHLFITQDLTITQGDSVEIHAVAEPAGTYNYLWQANENLTCPDCADTWAKPDMTTLYTIDVSDENKICIKEAKVKISVKPCGISIPEAFSPNNDQYNEVFFAYGNTCVKEIKEMVVYNRWGEVVFMKRNFLASDPSSGWSGTYKGLLSAPGLYHYKFKVELKNGNVISYNGVVNLLK